MENDSHLSSLDLEKSAVAAALKQDWKLSIELNLKLLDTTPEDKKAKMRLGRAYLQTNDFAKAQKMFKAVLKADPVNSIAKKNLELAKSKKKDKGNGNIDTSRLIKEPGTTTMEIIELSAKNLTFEDFEPREELGIKVNKASANVLQKNKVVGKIITPDLVKRLNLAKSKRATLRVSFYNGKANTIKIIIKSDIAVFKAERQELKPYMKKGTIDEPPVEMATTEEKK
ncbi:tetratricopeptide repeat protein [candidate division WWE3 bacterium]|jgi:tetratricopeptide (TPR) repeat protein|nr:tetratricopeptide repeat protein [candidate division WWE3 bacterium]MBT7350696.1 tetratricopeptide repeat protein [candidate division WWE3 bacterium]